MQNRPLCMVTVAYCTGVFIFFALHNSFIVNYNILIFPIGIVGMLYVILMHLYLKVKNMKRMLRYVFVYLAAAFLIIGAFSAKQKAKYLETNIPDNKSDIFLCGQIYQFEQKENSCAVYLKDCVYTYERDNFCGLAANRRSRLRCLIYTKDMNDFKIGSIITVRGEVSQLKIPSNRGQFDEKAYYMGIDIHFRMFADEILSYNECDNNFNQKMYNIRTFFHGRLSEIVDEKTSGIYQAMLLGEKGSVDSKTKDLFMRGSIGHILVVSGLHFSIIGMAVYKVLRRRFGFLVSGTISCSILFLFGIISGFSTSAIRAFIMFVIFMCANIWGCNYDMLTALSLAVLIILIHNPYTLFLSGFILSVSAVLGVIIVVPVLDNIFHFKSKIIKGMMASLGIQIFTLPVMLYYFYYFNPYSMIINAIVLPFMSFVLADGAGAVFGSLLSVFVGKILILPGKYILKGVIWACTLSSHLPFSSIYPGRPQFVTCVLYYVLLFLFLKLANRFNEILRVIPMMLVSLSLLFFIHKRYTLEITMLDVGQGQCVFIQTKSGHTMLYDGGSSDISDVGKYRIIPFLQANGSVSIDIVFVSHLDDDHISGIKEMIVDESINIKQLLLPETSFVDEAYLELEQLAKENDIPVNTFGKNGVIEVDKVRIEGLHPAVDFETNERNDTSIVFNLKYGDFDMLFCGDMEEEAMNQIISNDKLKDVNILQVAHHGSSYTTSEDFLKITKPEISLISCGENNRYGHPHQDLLERLESANSKYYVTMDCGEIDIIVSNNKYEVEHLK